MYLIISQMLYTAKFLNLRVAKIFEILRSYTLEAFKRLLMLKKKYFVKFKKKKLSGVVYAISEKMHYTVFLYKNYNYYICAKFIY